MRESDGSGWSGLPAAGPYREFTLGEEDGTLGGILYAGNGGDFDTVALSETENGEMKDFEKAVVLETAPFSATGTEHVSRPVYLTLQGESGYTRLRLASVAPDGSDFELWHSALSDLQGHITDEALVPTLLEAKAWEYTNGIMGNLDDHLGRVLDALEAGGRPWNVVMFTDHGFNSVSRIFYPNRALAEADLLTLDDEGAAVPAETVALYGFENAGGVHLNTVAGSGVSNGHQGGIVTDEELEVTTARVTEALLAARDHDGRARRGRCTPRRRER